MNIIMEFRLNNLLKPLSKKELHAVHKLFKGRPAVIRYSKTPHNADLSNIADVMTLNRGSSRGVVLTISYEGHNENEILFEVGHNENVLRDMFTGGRGNETKVSATKIYQYNEEE